MCAGWDGLLRGTSGAANPRHGMGSGALHSGPGEFLSIVRTVDEAGWGARAEGHIGARLPGPDRRPAGHSCDWLALRLGAPL
jgi:hypothetical protein